MQTRPTDHILRSLGWYAWSGVWGLYLLVAAVVFAFRAVKTSGIAVMIQFDDVPVLVGAQNHYQVAQIALIATGGVLTFFAILMPTPRVSEVRAWVFRAAVAATCLIVAINATPEGSGSALTVMKPNLADWAACLLAPTAAVLLAGIVGALAAGDTPEAALPTKRRGGVPRLPLLYLLSAVAIMAYALFKHIDYWKPNGDMYNYAKYLREGEVAQMNMVLYSCSLLFATLAFVLALIVWGLFRVGARAGGGRALIAAAGLTGVCVAVALNAPWLMKLRAEIAAESAWSFPVLIFAFISAAVIPLAAISLCFMKRDFESAGTSDRDRGRQAFMPEPAELVLLSALLFLVYPVLRAVRPRNRERFWFAALCFLAAVVLGALTLAVNKFGDWFDFDDWRGMIQKGELPFLQIVLALMSAAFVTLLAPRACRFAVSVWRTPPRAWRVTGLTPTGRRHRRSSAARAWRIAPRAWKGSTRAWRALESFLSRQQPEPIAERVPEPSRVAGTWALRISFAGAAAAVLVCALFPLWGWRAVPKNVLARAAEFSDRHDFELRFLQWVVDADRDGYSTLLHGADADDGDENICANGMAPIGPGHLPVPEVRVVDGDKLRDAPNILIFMLEGVTPKSVSCFGERTDEIGNAVTTPNMDALAREGSWFINTRVAYPSTWDGWAMTYTGRYMKIAEYTADQLQADRYSKFNVIHKACKKAEIDRTCFANCEPMRRLYLPAGDRDADWENSISTRPTDEEMEIGVRQGDHRSERMVRFINDLKPGEKFFMTEHMADTHFPWWKVEDERAMALKTSVWDGFPNGLGFVEACAYPGNDPNYGQKHYYHTVSLMDYQIGMVIDALKAKKLDDGRSLYDTTAIFIVGDHGCQWFEHERKYYVAHLYEPSLRNVMIVRMPPEMGTVQGQAVEEPVQQVDVVPTVLEMLGLALTGNAAEDEPPGRSLLPLLRGDASPEQRSAYRERDMLLTTHYDMIGCVEKNRYKLIFDRPVGTYLLFDLQEDPKEMHNLADEQPELLARMLKLTKELGAKYPALLGGPEGGSLFTMPK